MRPPTRPLLPAIAGIVVTALGLSSALVSAPAAAERMAERSAIQGAAAGMFPAGAPARVSTDVDRGSVEVGVRFRSKVAGRITGAQVYKRAASAGKTPRTASLWSKAGERLATASLPSQRGAGWVSVTFDQAVTIEPRTTYVISVFAPKGRYAITENALRKRTVRGDLVIPGKFNSVYRYAATSAFPNRSGRGANYWVDVTFKKSRDTSDPAPAPAPIPAPAPTPSTGFPNASNTGVPAGTALTAYTGPMTITTPNTVIDAKQIRGTLTVRATGVQVTRSSVSGSVVVESSGSLAISDTTIDAGDQPGTGLESYNYTATRVHITGGNRSAYCASDCTISDSYVHGQFTDETGVYHESGIRMEKNTTLIHNTIACDAPNVPPDAGCSAGLTGYGDFAPVVNNLIQGNLFLASTGGACAYGGSSGGKPYTDGARDIRFIDNVFERGSTGKCGYYAPIVDFKPSAPGNVFSGNTWVGGGVVRP